MVSSFNGALHTLASDSTATAFSSILHWYPVCRSGDVVIAMAIINETEGTFISDKCDVASIRVMVHLMSLKSALSATIVQQAVLQQRTHAIYLRLCGILLALPQWTW